MQRKAVSAVAVPVHADVTVKYPVLDESVAQNNVHLDSAEDSVSESTRVESPLPVDIDG